MFFFSCNACSHALEKDNIKIGKNAELHLLNFDEVNAVRKKVDETKQWNDFNAELKFRVIYDGKGFEELHYGLWGKILTDEEYREIIKREEEI